MGSHPEEDSRGMRGSIPIWGGGGAGGQISTTAGKPNNQRLRRKKNLLTLKAFGQMPWGVNNETRKKTCRRSLREGEAYYRGRARAWTIRPSDTISSRESWSGSRSLGDYETEGKKGTACQYGEKNGGRWPHLGQGPGRGASRQRQGGESVSSSKRYSMFDGAEKRSSHLKTREVHKSSEERQSKSSGKMIKQGRKVQARA